MASLLAKLFSLAVLSLTLPLMARVPLQLSRPPSEECECLCGAQASRLTVRHIEPKGIGYKKGYTTVEGFFAPDYLKRNAYFPFVDVRGHVFNDGKWAANAGVGLRYLKPDASRIYGANAYYDFRQSRYKNGYNQISLGLETLGVIWDARLRGYIPVAERHSSIISTDVELTGGRFLAHEKSEFSMYGVDGEVGAHLAKMEDMDFYAGVGPYYFTGEGKHALGGKARVTATFWKYLFLEGSVSYDHIFHTRGQGQIGLSLPFGKKVPIKKRGCLDCLESYLLRDRLVQPVYYEEIIVLKTHHKTKSFF